MNEDKSEENRDRWAADDGTPADSQEMHDRLTKAVGESQQEMLKDCVGYIHETGRGIGSIYMGRLHEGCPYGGITCILTGRISPDDMRRFKDFYDAFQQDVTAGSKHINKEEADNLPTSEQGGGV